MNENNKKGKHDPTRTPPVRPGTMALVQCEGFRCLARCDGKGLWRNRHGHVLNGAVRLIEEADYQMQSRWSAGGESGS